MAIRHSVMGLTRPVRCMKGQYRGRTPGRQAAYGASEATTQSVSSRNCCLQAKHRHQAIALVSPHDYFVWISSSDEQALTQLGYIAFIPLRFSPVPRLVPLLLSTRSKH